MKTLITIVTAVLLLMGCNGTTTTQKMNDTAPAIPDLLQVGHSILSRDAIEPTTIPY